jgi:nucleoside 2-deoxyribosyltransferase
MDKKIEDMKRTLVLVDLDETLLHTNGKIFVLNKNKKKIKELNNQEYNKYELKNGESYDFSDFRCAISLKKNHEPIKEVIDKVIEYKNKGASISILTARADFLEGHEKILMDLLNEYGLDVGHWKDNKTHIVRSGNEIASSTPERKVKSLSKILNKRASEFDNIIMLDDHKHNLIEVEKFIEEKYKNIKSTMYLVEKGKIKQMKKEKKEIDMYGDSIKFEKRLINQINMFFNYVSTSSYVNEKHFNVFELFIKNNVLTTEMKENITKRLLEIKINQKVVSKEKIEDLISLLKDNKENNNKKGKLINEKKLKIYLAGPDVFYPNSREISKELTIKCDKMGFQGMYPIDGLLELDGLSKEEAGVAICQKNMELIKESDIVIVNLDPHESKYQPDSGSVFEVGVAIALGKKVFVYMNDTRSYLDKHDKDTLIKRQKEGREYYVDVDELEIEDYDSPLNVMLGYSIGLNNIYDSFDKALEAAKKYANELSLNNEEKKDIDNSKKMKK